MKSTKKNKLIDSFWNWFIQNQISCMKIIDADETDLIDEVLINLVKIQRGLAVEFEKLKDKYVMTISADGIEDYFGIVQEIINRAPTVENWEFIAFRQPYGKEQVARITINVSGFTLDPKQIKFSPLIEDGNLYIQIFSADINEETKNKIGYGCLMLLDNIIGEYNCVKMISGFEYYNISESTGFSNKLKPLTEMREFIDSYYQMDKN